MRIGGWWGLALLAACAPPPETKDPPDDPVTSSVTTPPPDPTVPDTTPTVPPDETTTTPPAPAKPVWLAFSGGGYYAHTAHSGAMMGMLEASGLDLVALTANVVGIAANSGGTWFTTQLAFSEPFRAALEDDPDGWTTTGYLGQTEDLFAFDDACVGWPAPIPKICNQAPSLQGFFAMGKINGVPTVDWHEIVSTGVYAPFGMSSALGTLDGPREAWADGKTLVFASTVLTDQSLMEEEPGFLAIKDYSDAAPTTAGVPRQRNFAPAAFASPGADGIRPRFLLPGPLSVTYTTNEPFANDQAVAVVPDDASTDVPVVDAASASSALGSAAVSIGVLDESGISDPIPLTNDEIAYQMRDAAPGFSVTGGAVSFLRPVPQDIAGQAAVGALRIGDGSWTDDTAVAFAVRAMADTSALDDFTILSFVGGRSEPGGRGIAPLPVEFERLFSGGGEDAAGVVGICVDVLCVDTMSPAVFDGAALDAEVVRWSWTDGDVSMVHVEIPVVTVDNPTYGVTAGHAGVLHVVVTTVLDAPVVPFDDTSFTIWADTLAKVRAGMTDGGGWESLADVLGIR